MSKSFFETIYIVIELTIYKYTTLRLKTCYVPTMGAITIPFGLVLGILPARSVEIYLILNLLILNNLSKHLYTLTQN